MFSSSSTTRMRALPSGGEADVFEGTAAGAALCRNGAELNETPATQTGRRGARTRTWLGSVMFELVHSERDPQP